MYRNLLAAIMATAIVGFASAQPAPKPNDTKLVTKIYDLKPVIGEKKTASGISNMDGVIKLILETLDVDELKPGTAGPQLIEREDGKLEVRATAKTQEEIHDLIEALNLLADVAVDVKADVIELDPTTFAKLLKALPQTAKGKPESPVLFAIGEEIEEKNPKAKESKVTEKVTKILKEGRVVQTSTARYVNGSESTFSARQSVQTFYLGLVNNKPKGAPQFVKEGFKLTGIPIVSGDKRFVRLKLTDQSVVTTGIKKVDAGEVVTGQNLILTSLESEDLGSTGSAVVADGGILLFRLAYAPKDKVWVVILHPTIFIQAEADELKKQEKK